MSVDITIQETVNEVDITVNQNVITVNVTRTTGGDGVESINGETGVVVLTTDNVNEGLINLYFTAARVRATVLTGISFVSGIAITATDTILSAFGKLQKQISSLGDVAFSNNYNDLDNKPTIPSPQNLAQVLAIDNKTNDIPIVSNNGKATVGVNDSYLDISYEGNNLTLEPTNGLLLFSDTNVFTIAPIMVAVIDGEISYTCSSFLLNGEEVATQLWVTSQGYGTGTVTSVMGDLVDNTDPNNPVINTPIDKFSLQVTQSGTSAPVILSGSLKGNFGATITPSYSAAGVYLFTASLPIFANVKNTFKQTTNSPTNLLSGTAFFSYLGYYTFIVVSDTIAVLTVYNDIFAPGTSDDNLITEPILLELPYN